MQILVKTPTGKTTSVEINGSDTYNVILSKIWNKLGMIPPNQPLFMLDYNRDKYYIDMEPVKPKAIIRIPGSLHIFIRTITKTIYLEVHNFYTISDVKAMISAKEDVSPFNQRLFFAGMQLEDNRTVSDYNIYEEYTLDLVLHFGGRMTIFVETITGKTIPLEVHCHNTIREVKRLILEEESIPTEKQKLVYGGQKLDDHRILSYYCIQDESTLRLVDDTLMRDRGQMQIYINLVDNDEEKIHLEVDNMDTIDNVKAKIQEQKGIPTDKQMLFLPQARLLDGFTLADYYIRKGSTIQLAQLRVYGIFRLVRMLNIRILLRSLMVLMYLMMTIPRASCWVTLVHESTGFWKCNEIFDCDRKGGFGCASWLAGVVMVLDIHCRRICGVQVFILSIFLTVLMISCVQTVDWT
ncbi:polyubiquitin [Artemisia annua]|uniref:Polyubiquitin n=1 Tax=Artemisia annua TaxID=35608 RepID=A0A2U1Q7Q2_ARTAN|nr:polyubiquitin [Artemisia annua]